MRLRENVERSYAQFRQAAQQTKVVLLHPASRFRSPLVARLLDSQDEHVLYYAMGMDDISVDSVVAGMTHDISNHFPMFGRHLNMLTAQEQSDLPTLIRAFQRELNDLADKPVMLILDEYDRSDPADDVQAFIEMLAANLPSHCCMVINSRTMPRLPWVSMIARQRALLLRDDEIVAQDFYGSAQGDKFELEVYALGPGIVLVNGQMVEDWEGHLPRLLFFFALDKPVITRSEICRAFWPELDVEQAVNVFHVTKRRLHKALGVDFDVLLHEDGYYRLNPELSIDFDVMRFVSALMDARAAGENATFEQWQRIADLYRGPFLQGHHEPWIVLRRHDYRAGYLEALTAMADIRMADDRHEHALSLLLRAASEDPRREDLHLRIIDLYRQLGRRSEGAAHYMKLTEQLKRQGGQPGEALQQAYAELTDQ